MSANIAIAIFWNNCGPSTKVMLEQANKQGMKRRCEFTKEGGLKCKNVAQPEKQFCRVHARIAGNDDSSSDDEEPQPKKVNVGAARVHVDCVQGIDDILKTITERLQNLEVRMRDTLKRKVSVDREKKARQLFYHEHKRHTAVIKPLQDTFKNMGYPEDAPIPWQVVKRKCDMLYDMLSDKDKEKYLQEAVAP